MGLIVKKSGIMTTVQDLGRTGSRRFGINPNGVMDIAAARLINIILGNDDNEAVLEMHFPAGEFEFEDEAVFALGGADLGAEIDGKSVPMWATYFARSGSVLKFTKKQAGSRAYLAVKGGFAVSKWLGSASTNLIAELGGIDGGRLQAGDRVGCETSGITKILTIGTSIRPLYSRFPTVRFVPGVEFASLTALSERKFLSDSFTLSNDSNRMGFRLSGGPLHLLDSDELVSAAVCFGTIQLLPDGQIVILMADHQTSGGYPRIGNVISVDLPILAQLGPGDKVGFHTVSVEEAERLAIRFERDLCFLRLGCRLSQS